MNIALISNLFPNCTAPTRGTFVMEKAQALRRLATVTVCAPVAHIPILRTKPPPREQAGDLTVLHAAYPALPQALFQYRWRAYQRTLPGFFRRMPPPDVLLIDWLYPDAYAVMQFCRQTGRRIPIVITAHGANAIGYYTRSSRSRFYIETLRKADCIIAVSSDMRNKILSMTGRAAGNIKVIGNGIDRTLFRPMPPREARARLQLDPDQPLLLTIARLAPEKALHLLLRALQLCQNRRAQLVIIGSGPRRRGLQGLVRRLQLVDRVRFMGALPREALPAWLAAADVFALSSLHEGDPVVIREALACGTPVVAPRVGGIPETVPDNRYGLLCEPNDSLQLAHALDAAMERSWDRAAISRYGGSQTWDMVAERLFEICQSLTTIPRG
ncbi:MAG: glycosyltransferase [Kiritimatiellia bacterium]